MKVVIPSMGRSERVRTLKIAPDAILCIPESEVGMYSKNYPSAEILSHPDTLKGIAAKRDFILRKFSKEPVVMLDDDLSALCRLTSRPGSTGQNIRDADLINDILLNTVQMAAEAGAYLFGWETSSALVTAYTGHKPFALSGFINGCAMGFLPGHGLVYDTRLTAKCDYDICLQNALRNRYSFIDKRYAFVTSTTMSEKGGAAAVRSVASERKDIELLKRKWGDAIRVSRRVTGTRQKTTAGGIEQVSLRLPF
jgi:hypothetical protein